MRDWELEEDSGPTRLEHLKGMAVRGAWPFQHDTEHGPMSVSDPIADFRHFARGSPAFR